MFHLYFEFRLLLIFYFVSLFSGREADGILRILVMNLCSRWSVKIGGHGTAQQRSLFEGV